MAADPGIPGPAAAHAKAVCARCPVQAECLSYPLATSQQHGIWGGLDEWERDNLLRQRHQHRDGTHGAA